MSTWKKCRKCGGVMTCTRIDSCDPCEPEVEQVADEVIDEKESEPLYTITPPKWINDGLHLRIPDGVLVLEREHEDELNPAWAVHLRTLQGQFMGPTARFDYDPNVCDSWVKARKQAVEWAEFVYYNEVRKWLVEATDDTLRDRFPFVPVVQTPIDWDAIQKTMGRSGTSSPEKEAAAIDDKGQIKREEGSKSANDEQVGGNHYRKVDGEQHWDRMWRTRGRGYFIGNITAYAERYDQKNGVEDLRKIIHYCRKLIELEQAATAGTGPPPGVGNSEVLSPKKAGLQKEDKT